MTTRPPQPGSAPAPTPAPASAVTARPRMTVRRVTCGVLWAVYTAILVIGGLATLFGGNATGLLMLLLGALTGWYDYRIWTFKAKRLTYLIIF